MSHELQTRIRQAKKGNKMTNVTVAGSESPTTEQRQTSSEQDEVGGPAKPAEPADSMTSALEPTVEQPTGFSVPERYLKLGIDMEAVLLRLKPTSTRILLADHCLQELRLILQRLGPEWDVSPFGSLANGFGTIHSDLDATCCHSTLELVEDTQQHAASVLGGGVLPMVEQHPQFLVKECVLHARVPILRLRFQNALDVDLSCHNPLPLMNTRLLEAYSAIDPRVMHLGILIKQWAKGADVCDAARSKLSSYAFTLLVIYFLQVAPGVRLPILPVEVFAFRTRTEDKRLVAAVVTAARAKFKCDLSLAELISEFFAFYSNHESQGFAWGHEVASVRMGFRCLSSESMFSSLRGKSDSRLHIEDPYELERNLHGVLGKIEEQQLQAAFTEAFQDIRNGKTPVGMIGQDPHKKEPPETAPCSLGAASQVVTEQLARSVVHPERPPGTQPERPPGLITGTVYKDGKWVLLDKTHWNLDYTLDMREESSRLVADSMSPSTRSGATSQTFESFPLSSSDEEHFLDKTSAELFEPRRPGLQQPCMSRQPFVGLGTLPNKALAEPLMPGIVRPHLITMAPVPIVPMRDDFNCKSRSSLSCKLQMFGVPMAAR